MASRINSLMRGLNGLSRGRSSPENPGLLLWRSGEHQPK
ncbi:hypothetical protein M7I_0498 [Glarea lozoyensis 74030]|uniref:Uncharacterized protein n=1 Tax=Glarea lozoyensis (strain ATCC 74030 / MF5533) TaxID=1104152 RepID=H0EDP3_GLAL7|nr:hypothetical protein M7I_0498 [Glarea lozoyensis 74030]